MAGHGLWCLSQSDWLNIEETKLITHDYSIINVLGSSLKNRTSLLCDKFKDIATSGNNEKPNDSNPGYFLYVHNSTDLISSCVPHALPFYSLSISI